MSHRTGPPLSQAERRTSAASNTGTTLKIKCGTPRNSWLVVLGQTVNYPVSATVVKERSGDRSAGDAC